MKFLIVTDAYFPNNSSVSVLLSDLAQEFIAQSIDVDILVSVAEQDTPIKIWNHNGCEVISIKALKTKDISYFRRTINEFINPWLIWRTLEKSPGFMSKQYDGVIWYSPTIFWGPLIKKLKRKFQCRSYLILRDLFPDWALHVGVLKKGLVYSFFKMVEQYQYRQADCIGVQSPNNLQYFQKHYAQFSARAEVLWNWVSPIENAKNTIKPTQCSIVVNETSLKGRIVIVYTGNLGMAQGGFSNLIELAKLLHVRSDVGILVVGRGSEIAQLRHQIAIEQLTNIVVHDEIAANEIPALLEQCHMGLVLLDQRHQTHNIPGKFLIYLQSQLPVLAWVNSGNDLIDLNLRFNLGVVYDGDSIIELANLVNTYIKTHLMNPKLLVKSQKLLEEIFSPNSSAMQISLFLSQKN